MKAKPAIVAQKLLNLYRQHHVIIGSWEAINPILLAEADENVITEIKNLPTGNMLVQHIESLRSKKTAMNTISPELLPYGGLMSESAVSIDLSEAELTDLSNALADFVPDADCLDKIKSLPVVKKFGDEWQVAIRSALSGDKQLLEKWNIVTKTARAFYLWKVAHDMLSGQISERTRAHVQADLPEYETYLPMFGEAGKELLSKLRTSISSV